MKIHGVQHIGFTVPDMAQAVGFFETLFGAVTCLTTGPLAVDGAYMQRRLGAAEASRIRDIRVLRTGNGANLEIFEYHGDPDADAPWPRNSQPGGYHIAFEVEDCQAEAARLRAAGVEVLDGPTYVDAGPMQGLTWCYLRAPWGQSLEIVSMDGPLAAERDGGPAQWSPKAQG